MRLRFEELGATNFKGVRERIGVLEKHVKEVFGDTWTIVQDDPGNRRELKLVCHSGCARNDDTWLTSCAILWDARKQGHLFRSLEYSRSHSMWTCPWSVVQNTRHSLPMPELFDFILGGARTQ